MTCVIDVKATEVIWPDRSRLLPRLLYASEGARVGSPASLIKCGGATAAHTLIYRWGRHELPTGRR